MLRNSLQRCGNRMSSNSNGLNGLQGTRKNTWSCAFVQCPEIRTRLCKVPNRELQVIGQHHRCSVGSAVFYVERTHYKSISCNVKREISSAMSGWNGLAMLWLWKNGRSSRICSNNSLLSEGSICHNADKNVDQRNHRLGRELSNRFFAPKLVSDFLANESFPPEFDAFHVLKARSHIFSLTFRHKRTSQMHQCVFPFSNRALCVQ